MDDLVVVDADDPSSYLEVADHSDHHQHYYYPVVAFLQDHPLNGVTSYRHVDFVACVEASFLVASYPFDLEAFSFPVALVHFLVNVAAKHLEVVVGRVESYYALIRDDLVVVKVDHRLD